MALKVIDEKLTEGNYIIFYDMGVEIGENTNTYFVQAKEGEEELGKIEWFDRWQKYVFSPVGNTLYEETCLRDIAEFCETRTCEYKARQQ